MCVCVCVCVHVCVRVCVCARALRIVSRDKTLCFKNTFIIIITVISMLQGTSGYKMQPLKIWLKSEKEKMHR